MMHTPIKMTCISVKTVYKKRNVESIFDEPSNEHLEMARKEINESDEKMKHNQQLIEEWIRCQKHFPQFIDKLIVRGFLRGCKHNLEKTKKKLELHLSAKTVYPDTFFNRSPFSKDITKAMERVNICFLPKEDKGGYRVAVVNVKERNEELDVAAAIKLFFMMYDLAITSDYPCTGESIIFDAAGVSSTLVAKFIANLKLLTVTLREAYAIRLKRIHLVNVAPAVEKVVTLAKPLLHHNVRNTFIVHKNNEDLCDFFGADCLPSDYDGKLPSVAQLTKKWYDILQENADWYAKLEEMKLLGPVPKKFESNLHFGDQLGVEGSFRKLDID